MEEPARAEGSSQSQRGAGRLVPCSSPITPTGTPPAPGLQHLDFAALEPRRRDRLPEEVLCERAPPTNSDSSSCDCAVATERRHFPEDSSVALLEALVWTLSAAWSRSDRRGRKPRARRRGGFHSRKGIYAATIAWGGF